MKIKIMFLVSVTALLITSWVLGWFWSTLFGLSLVVFIVAGIKILEDVIMYPKE